MSGINKELLKSISTQELVNELVSRKGVEYGDAGKWKKYRVTRAYENTPQKREVLNGQIIIIT